MSENLSWPDTTRSNSPDPVKTSKVHNFVRIDRIKTKREISTRAFTDISCNGQTPTLSIQQIILKSSTNVKNQPKFFLLKTVLKYKGPASLSSFTCVLYLVFGSLQKSCKVAL